MGKGKKSPLCPQKGEKAQNQKGPNRIAKRNDITCLTPKERREEDD